MRNKVISIVLLGTMFFSINNGMCIKTYASSQIKSNEKQEITTSSAISLEPNQDENIDLKWSSEKFVNSKCEINGVVFKKESKNKDVTIIAINNEKVHNIIVIPSKIVVNDITYKVSKVNNDAFINCNDIKEIYIPNELNIKECTLEDSILVKCYTDESYEDNSIYEKNAMGYIPEDFKLPYVKVKVDDKNLPSEYGLDFASGNDVSYTDTN